ncbi:MAG: NADH-quinone oxidoreductase subunit N [Phycisphaerales bacterium]|nr:NADH-quinone oxidoreductase subunit N [Phycisphaerales bacterium]
MTEKLALVLPELVLFIATCLVMITGQWPVRAIRNFTPWICGIALLIAGMLATQYPGDPHALFPNLVPYAKFIIAAVAILLLINLTGTVDRDLEDDVDQGKPFLPLRSTGGEFYAFFMFSITGLMLTASADDLIWLFLALELTSLPTYIMVAISTHKNKSREAAVKYFFLGAMGAAIFLYGFALIYGAAGSTNLADIAAVFAKDGLSTLGLAGILLAILGIGFKIAAFPMHFYTPDVYQGAASSVSAMLAFVPKTAGFLALIFIVATVGWNDSGRLPESVEAMIWIIAALTMFVGNTLALLQNSVKRMLAYSSVAHSGYMLVGILAGPGQPDSPFYRNGIAAILFYLLTYGIMTVGVFAVLGALEKRNTDGSTSEADDIEDLRGLCKTHPVLGWTVVLCALSMLGFPPLLGFIGKLGLFSSGISAGQIPIIIILGINSAIAAVYYLRMVAVVYLDKKDQSDTKPASIITLSPFPSRRLAGACSAIAVVLLLVIAQPLISAAHKAANFNAPIPDQIDHTQHDQPTEHARTDYEE